MFPAKIIAAVLTGATRVVHDTSFTLALLRSRTYESPLLKEIRHNPLPWLLALVPVVLAAQRLKPGAHTLLFLLSVAAIKQRTLCFESLFCFVDWRIGLL